MKDITLLLRMCPESLSDCHAGPEEPAPYSDTGASRRRPDKSREPSQRLGLGFHREPWIPAFAGMTLFNENVIHSVRCF